MCARNSHQERERLAARYRQLPEGKIEQLAHEAWKLTELGREVLRGEIARRGLALALADAPEDPSYSELVTIRRYRDVPEALVAQSVLASAEIECFLADDIVIRLDWYLSNALGGVRVRVREEDASRSIEILNSNRNQLESFTIGEVGEFTQPRCPNCNSLDISLGLSASIHTYLIMMLFTLIGWAPLVILFFLSSRRADFSPFLIVIAYGALILPTVFPIRPAIWTCDSCGHWWDTSKDPPPNPPAPNP